MFSARFFLCMSLLFVGSFCRSIVYADEPIEDSLTIDDMYLDYAIPDLSAAALLGMNSNLVSRPGNIKEFSVALLDATNDRGNIVSGVALEWAPAQSLGSQSVKDFRNNLLRAFQFSFATAKDTTATDVGIGIRWVPFDRSDPIFDDNLNGIAISCLTSADTSVYAAGNVESFFNDIFTPGLRDLVGDEGAGIVLIMLASECDNGACDVREAYSKAIEKLTSQGIELPQSRTPELLGLLQKYIDLEQGRVDVSDINECIIEAKKQFKKNSWNATVVHLGIGSVFSSPTSTWRGLKSDKVTGFLGVAFGVSQNQQSILQVQISRLLGDRYNRRWEYTVGGRLIFGGSDFRLSIEEAYTNINSLVPGFDGDVLHSTLGLEFKMSQGFWLEIAIGGNFPQEGGFQTEITSRVNIKYTLREDRRFEIP